MDRRGFLRCLGLGAAAAVAPTKAYSFLGGILRPRGVDSGFGFLWTPESAPLTIVDWVKMHPRLPKLTQAYIDSLMVPNTICDDIPWLT